MTRAANLLHINANQRNTMKRTGLLTAIAFAFALLAGTANVQAGCCDDAKKAGKACAHKCCIEAAKAKKTCEKCNPKKDAKKEAPAPAK